MSRKVLQSQRLLCRDAIRHLDERIKAKRQQEKYATEVQHDWHIASNRAIQDGTEGLSRAAK